MYTFLTTQCRIDVLCACSQESCRSCIFTTSAGEAMVLWTQRNSAATCIISSSSALSNRRHSTISVCSAAHKVQRGNRRQQTSPPVSSLLSLYTTTVTSTNNYAYNAYGPVHLPPRGVTGRPVIHKNWSKLSLHIVWHCPQRRTDQPLQITCSENFVRFPRWRF